MSLRLKTGGVTPGRITRAIYHHSTSALSQSCSPAGLDYFPSSNDRIMSDMFKEVALASGVEEVGADTHTQIPDASLVSVTLCSRGRFRRCVCLSSWR